MWSLPLVSLKGAVLKSDMKAIQRGASTEKRICFSVRKNPSPRPAYPYKAVRLQKRSAAVPVRSSNTSPVCVKVSGALNLLDTQSGGQVFHSDVINHSPITLPRSAEGCSFPSTTYFCPRGSRGSLSTPEAGLLSSNCDMWSAISQSNWLRT